MRCNLCAKRVVCRNLPSFFFFFFVTVAASMATSDKRKTKGNRKMRMKRSKQRGGGSGSEIKKSRKSCEKIYKKRKKKESYARFYSHTVSAHFSQNKTNKAPRPHTLLSATPYYPAPASPLARRGKGNAFAFVRKKMLNTFVV